MQKLIWLLLFSFLLTPSLSTAQPESTGGCHCFRHRTFDPDHTFSADEYLLASSYNSLIAATLDISKRQIVMKKMTGGINGDDLLIGLYIAKKTAKPLNLLLNIRDNGGSWQEIVTAPGIMAKKSADPILHAISSGQQAESLTKMITNYMIETYYNYPKKEIQSVQKFHLSDKETALLFALERQTGASQETLMDLSQKQKKSWSEIAHLYKLDPAQIGSNILGEKKQ